MSTSTLMDTPERPPIVIPPLTSMTDDGEFYTRPDAVEDELRSVLPRGPAEWVKSKKVLKSESLVFLSRYIRGSDDYAAGRLQEELGARTLRMGRGWIYGIYKEATEFILFEVESEIMVLLLAEVPSRQSEYLEIAFGQAVYRHTKNAVDRFQNTPLAHKDDALEENYDEDGGETESAVDLVAEPGARADETLIENETEALWAVWVQQALKFVTDSKHREAVILRHLKGWPVTSKDPKKSCLTRRFKISARQLQTWDEIALRQMKEGMMGEGYDRAKPYF